jgi:hypothetical protein
MIATLPWFAWIAIVAIVGGTVSSLVKTWILHRERMAMIERGLHPDEPGPSGVEAKSPYREL